MGLRIGGEQFEEIKPVLEGARKKTRLREKEIVGADLRVCPELLKDTKHADIRANIRADT